MSTFHLTLLIFSSLLPFALGHPESLTPNEALKKATHPKDLTPHEAPPKKMVALEGIVYCQSCEHAGTWSLAVAKPLPSAKVGISCKGHKNRVRFYKAVQTDNNGYFYVFVEGSKLKDLIDACTVRLLSSPYNGCNLLTNINYGIDGSPLRDEKKRVVTGVGFETVVYAAGPLAFRPVHSFRRFTTKNDTLQD